MLNDYVDVTSVVCLALHATEFFLAVSHIGTPVRVLPAQQPERIQRPTRAFYFPLTRKRKKQIPILCWWCQAAVLAVRQVMNQIMIDAANVTYYDGPFLFFALWML